MAAPALQQQVRRLSAQLTQRGPGLSSLLRRSGISSGTAPQFSAAAALDDAASAATVPQQVLLQQQAASFHARSGPSVAAAVQEAVESSPTRIPFPREGPGVNYALNWSLAAAGVTPTASVSRNLNKHKLKELSKTKIKAVTGSKVLVKGDDTLPGPKFNKILKEVAAHLSGLPSLYVHDGAVGSSSASDVRVRVIADSPAAADVLSSILTPTPTRTLAASSFPITVYAAPSYSNEAAGAGATGFIAADLGASLVVVAGSAVGDEAAIKSVLAAAAVSPALRRGALVLPARFVESKGSRFIVLPPSSAGATVLGKAALWPELGLVWGAAGVARPFALPPAASKTAPNAYGSPSALVLLTSDSTGALPTAQQLTPQQAAYYYLLGYDGVAFNPACAHTAFGLGGAAAPSLAETLSSLLLQANTPAYLVNAFGADDVGKLVSTVAGGNIPSSQTSEPAVAALKSKFDVFVQEKFPGLPESIAP